MSTTGELIRKRTTDRLEMDIVNLRRCLDDFQKGSGIPLGQFIDLLSLIVQEMRLHKEVMKS